MKLNFEQIEDRITGTVTGPNGRTYAIEDGTMRGTALAFHLSGDGPLHGARVTGQSDGEKLTVTIRTRRGELKGVATRVK